MGEQELLGKKKSKKQKQPKGKSKGAPGHLATDAKMATSNDSKWKNNKPKFFGLVVVCAHNKNKIKR